MTLLLTACGSSSEGYGTTDDLECIPVIAEDNRFAYIDVSDGKEKQDVGVGYEQLSMFYDGYARVYKPDSGWVFIDKKGEPINKKVYRNATTFSEGVAWVSTKGGPLELINTDGETVFEFKQAEVAYSYYDGLAIFANAEGKYGVVDKKGNVVMEPRWKNMIPVIVDGIMFVETDSGWGMADKEGNMILNGGMHNICFDTDDIESVAKGRSRYKSYSFQTCLNAIKDNRILVEDENYKWGVVNKKGEYVINPQFDDLLVDGDNYLFRKGDSYGWCNETGEYKINPQFSHARPFNGNDLAAAADDNGDWGLIDKEGKWKVNPQFGNIKEFLPNGLAPAEDDKSGDWGLIDKEGKWKVNPQFGKIFDIGLNDKLIVVDSSGKVGVIDGEGKFVVNPNYTMPYEVLFNATGYAEFTIALSDYVDVQMYAGLIENTITSLKKTTAGDLKTAYKLEDSNFPKYGGNANVYYKAVANGMSFNLQVRNLTVWSMERQGWSYKYVFNPGAPVDSYVLTVDYKGKVAEFGEEIFKVLTDKYGYDSEHWALNIPGYSVTVEDTLNPGIIFYIQPEK